MQRMVSTLWRGGRKTDQEDVRLAVNDDSLRRLLTVKPAITSCRLCELWAAFQPTRSGSLQCWQLRFATEPRAATQISRIFLNTMEFSILAEIKLTFCRATHEIFVRQMLQMFICVSRNIKNLIRDLIIRWQIHIKMKKTEFNTLQSWSGHIYQTWYLNLRHKA